MIPEGRQTFFTTATKFAVNKGADGKPTTLEGYALVWNQVSDDRGGYKVRLMPNSAKFSDPTLALFMHDFSSVIGNSANGTLRFSSDNVGVKVQIDLPDTSVGRDVGELVGKGYVAGMSFAMVKKPDGRVVRENGLSIFEATGYEVDEVTVTPIPAFNQARVGVLPPDKGFSALRTSEDYAAMSPITAACIAACQAACAACMQCVDKFGGDPTMAKCVAACGDCVAAGKACMDMLKQGSTMAVGMCYCCCQQCVAVCSNYDEDECKACVAACKAACAACDAMCSRNYTARVVQALQLEKFRLDSIELPADELAAV